MADRDMERDAKSTHSSTSRSDTSSEFSVSTDKLTERTSLLVPGGPIPADYKSTALITADVRSDSKDDEPLLGPEVPKSVFAIISLLMVGVFMSSADVCLVLATYGTISSEFGALADASWLTTTYSLATCAAQPVTGKLSDIYGRKGVLLTSYVLFALGSVVCGIGQSMWQVIAGRIIAGLGAAGMTVIVAVLITDLVPSIQVASWRGYVNVVAAVGRSIGGPLGGYLADTVGWRWSFIGQGPLIAIAIVLVALRLPSHSHAYQPQVQQKGQPSKLRRIDFIGAILLALTNVTLLGALSLGGQSLPWSNPIVISLLIASPIIGTSFVLYELKVALEPILPPLLMIERDVATNYAINALQSAAQFTMIYTVPLYFRATQNSSNTEAGAHLFPAVLGNTAGGLLAGLVIQRTGRYKNLSILAVISSSLSYILLITRWKGEAINWQESLAILPGGFGTGLAMATTFQGLTSVVKRRDVAVATGGFYLWTGVGMVVGVASGSAVQTGSLRTLLVDGLRSVPGAETIIENAISDVSSIAGLESGVRRVVIDSYVKSLENSHYLSLGCSVAALVLAFTVREHRLK